CGIASALYRISTGAKGPKSQVRLNYLMSEFQRAAGPQTTDNKRAKAEGKSSVVSDAQFVGHSYQIGQPFCIQLGHQLVTMNLHRDFAQSHLGGDLLVEKARGYQRQYFSFPSAETFV